VTEAACTTGTLRPNRRAAAALTLLALLACAPAAVARKRQPAPPPAAEEATIAAKTEGLERREGLLTVHLDRKAGKVWLELPPAGEGGEIGRFLYVQGLLHGLGSNPVGLDRGKLGSTRLVVLRRVGGRVLVEQPNLAYRALTDDPREARAVEQSFATSVLWATEVAVEEPDGRTLIDFTSFVVRDAFGVAATLERSAQGSFSLDEGRSALDVDACLSFPDNLEFEALLTFTGKKPGRDVRSVTPTPTAVTLVQHHSLVRLPDDGYRPREFDPRAGSFSVWFQDYAAPLDRPIERRLIVRHRLEKTDPSAERSTVKEPIVYYVDPGAPEPVRSALVDGARWWAAAFEAAGFIDAFRVELLPEGAHPLDVRYNVIQWVHRSTRGWSYGGGVTDPRTGEMIKGHVSLGSLRVRQDRLLFEGLLGTAGTGSGAADDPVQLALARIRQLSAHEVGHTLGFTHNFAASTYADRASVMDYPAPLIDIAEDGTLDTSRAYGVGVGAWDVHTVRYAYSEFPPGTDEAPALEAIVRDGLQGGYRFLADADARPAGAAHPLANLWDNGDDPVAAFRHALEVRRIALERFGPDNLAPGRPLALLEEVLVPVYFHHRFQLNAAVKTLGGMEYAYAVRGDGQPTARPLDGERQREGLHAVLELLDPARLDLPDRILELIVPRPFGHWRNRELFPTQTAPAFDPLTAAAAAAGQVVDGVLQPERLNRVASFHRRDPERPGVDEVLAALVDTAFGERSALPERQSEIRRAVQSVVVAGLRELAADEAARSTVRAAAERALSWLAERLDTRPAHDAWLRRTIERFLTRGAPAARATREAEDLPPGDPIGTIGMPPDTLGGCSLSER
jgi:hypothetical protein